MAFIHNAHLIRFRNIISNNQPNGKLDVTICKLKEGAGLETAENLLAKDPNDKKIPHYHET